MEHRTESHGYRVAALAAALVLAALSSTAVAEKKMYKWTDEEGNVHFSESLPPDYKDEGHDIYNEDGLLIGEDEKLTPEYTPPPEEAEEEPEEELPELPRDASGLPRGTSLFTASEKQQKMDSFLMLRYESEQEIKEEMDLDINQLDYDRRLLKGSIDSMHDAYLGEIRIAANKQRAGLDVDNAEARKISRHKLGIEDNQRKLEALNDRENEIRQEFQERLDRYRYLMERHTEPDAR